MKKTDEDEIILSTVAHIHATILAVICGLVGGGVIFLMTAWLLIKGGETVGPHLRLLSQFFFGYSVSWGGSLIGFIWGFVYGAIIGWIIGKIYNRIIHLRYTFRNGGNA
jgi:hypothetical protein